MTATATTGVHAPVFNRGGDAEAPGVKGPGGRRRAWRVAAGAACAIVASAVCVWIVSAVDSRDDVLVAAVDVSAGHVLTPDDVAVTRMGADPGAGLVSAERAGEIAGQAAAFGMPAGTVLTDDMLTDAEAFPESGKARVSLEAASGQVPAGTAAGDAVAILVPDHLADADGEDAVAPSGADAVGEVARVEAVVVSTAAVETGVEAAGEAAVVTVECAETDLPILAGSDSNSWLIARVGGA